MRDRMLRLATALVALLAAGPLAAQDLVKKGEYVFHAAGCKGCHTDVATKGPPLAGGRALKTPFGTFYSPNITKDPTHGIGTWSDADFVRAVKGGIDKQGHHLFPAFPFPSYAGMTDDDAKAIKAYIFSLPAVDKPNKPHDVSAPFNWRVAAWGWQLLFFQGPAAPPLPAGASDEIKRGYYLANALGHCGECHTARNQLGVLDLSRHLGGNPAGPGGRIPNITPDKTGIERYSVDDLVTILESGMTPDGDVVGGEMTEVVEETTGKLTPEDRKALAVYLKSIPPVFMEPRKK